MELFICKDINAISDACSRSFLIGSPDTTMYASPIVSTYNIRSEFQASGRLKVGLQSVNIEEYTGNSPGKIATQHLVVWKDSR